VKQGNRKQAKISTPSGAEKAPEPQAPPPATEKKPEADAAGKAPKPQAPPPATEKKPDAEAAGKEPEKKAAAPAPKPFVDKDGNVERFPVLLRVQHILLFTSCLVLIFTGLPLKFPEWKLSVFFFDAIGGLEPSRFIHRLGAVVLIAVGLFHLYYIALTKSGRMNFLGFFPAFKDFKDVFHNVMYMLGFRDDAPRFDRFSYVEKFDYWAVYWGMVVMILSGLILWFEDLSLALFPKYFLDIAHEAHSDEALLATLAIIVWHFYNVHFNPDRFPMSWTWWHGKISEKEMKHHHPVEYERLAKAAGLEVEDETPEPIRAGDHGPPGE